MTTIGLWLSTPEPLIAEAAARAQARLGRSRPAARRLGPGYRVSRHPTARRARHAGDRAGLRAGAGAHAAAARPWRVGRRDRHGLRARRSWRTRCGGRATSPRACGASAVSATGCGQRPTDPRRSGPHIYPMIEDSAASPTSRTSRRSRVSPACTSGRSTSGSGSAWIAKIPDSPRRCKTILEAGHAAGIAGHDARGPAGTAAGWMEMGFDELVLTADIELIRTAFATQLAQLRSN